MDFEDQDWQSWEEYISDPATHESLEQSLLEEYNVREAHFSRISEIDKEKPVYATQTFLVDGLMPTGEVHVLVGASGVGKSSFLYNFINDWQHEKKIFGRKTTWYPYAVLSNDRSKAGIMRTLQRLDLNPKLFNIQETLGIEYKGGYKDDGQTHLMSDLEFVIRESLRKNKELKVFFVEGLHVGQAEGNDYGAASRALQGLNALCQRCHLTIVGTTHSPKNNPAVESSRESIIGSVANGGMVETIIAFQKNKGKVKVTIIPRQERELTVWHEWSPEGRLIECEEPFNETEFMFLTWLTKQDGIITMTDHIIPFFRTELKMSRPNAYKYKDIAVKKGYLVDLGGRKGFLVVGGN
jgi:hypothetical protein